MVSHTIRLSITGNNHCFWSNRWIDRLIAYRLLVPRKAIVSWSPKTSIDKNEVELQPQRTNLLLIR